MRISFLFQCHNAGTLYCPSSLLFPLSRFAWGCAMDNPRGRSLSSVRGSSYYSSADASSETSSDSDDSPLEFAAIRVRPAFFHEDRLLRFAANPSGFRNAVTRPHMVAFTASYRFSWVLLSLGNWAWCQVLFTARTVHRRLRRIFRLRD